MSGSWAFRTAPEPWVRPLAAWSAFMRLRDLSPQTIELRVYHLRRFAIESGVEPFDVTLDDLAVWLGTKSWGNATSSSVRASLRMFYEWAATTGKIAASPAAKLPKVKPPKPHPKPVPEDDYARSLAAADPLVRMALRLAGDLGMRRAEVAQVHRDDLLSTEDGYLLKILGKGRKERTIPVPARLAEDLLAHIDALGRGGYAFPGPTGGHLSPHWLGTLMSRALPDGFTGHKLRHRALTQAYRASKDILATAALAGHSSTATTQAYYVEPDFSALRSIVEGIAS